MRVLLVQPRYTYGMDLPLLVEMPIGLCYIAAVLRERGYKDVRILDCLAEGYKTRRVAGTLVTYGLRDEEIARRVRDFKPDVVGCSNLFSMQYKNALGLCELIKSVDPKIITVLGGMHPTVRPREVLAERSVDFILKGEADYTFSELVDALAAKKDYTKIDGLGYKDGAGIHINPKERFIEDLDALPLPARDLLPVENYFRCGKAHGFLLKDKRNANLITSRGCPAGCVFCTIHLMWGKRFRARSPENVMAELRQLKEEYAVRHIQFEDDNLTYDIERSKKIFRGMIDEKLKLSWTTPNGVAAWRMDTQLLDLMKRAGCYYIKFAVESADQRVLSDIIQKPQDLAGISSLIRYARKIGMRVGSFFVVGLPDETKEQIQKTFDFPHKVRLDMVSYSIATPHYGSRLRSICEERGYLKEHNEQDLYASRGLIDTPEFSSRWLEAKLARETKKYLRHLALHQPLTLLGRGWEVFKRNPGFVIKYFTGIFNAE